MPNKDFLDELNRRLSEIFAQSPAKDIERNVRAMLTSMFARLDLVTREEFDVQAELLARTQQKLAELEARLAALEAAPSKED
ncbi:MAG: accessory factor UbiK family protein [Burkholderiales bacterium]|nr:accessory factor UbiK family protein [Burkholderiales bacterium]